MTALNHYKNFLSELYSWSLGNKEEIFARNKDWLISKGIKGSVLDLGAGFGSHAIPAFELGLDVTAVDFSSQLLAELIEENADIRAIESDIVEYLNTCTHFDNIFCLGDTLTHLDEVRVFLTLLNQKGKRIFLSWRDYKTLPFSPANSHIIVREENGQVMTCDLEVINDQKIKVTDTFAGKSHSYEKLRITPDEVSGFFPGRKIETVIQGRLVQMEIN